LKSLQRSPDPLAGFQGFHSKRREIKGRKGRERGNKSPEWLSQKLGSTANAAVNSETALNLIRLYFLSKIIKIVATRCHI